MRNTADSIHGMEYLFIILECIFIILMLDILFDNILCFALGRLYFLSIFIMISYKTVHLTSELDKFSEWNTSSLIFHLANYFFICDTKICIVFLPDVIIVKVCYEKLYCMTSVTF